MYLQFHNGFMPGEQYPQSYNGLAKTQVDAGVLGPMGSPGAAPRASGETSVPGTQDTGRRTQSKSYGTTPNYSTREVHYIHPYF